MQGENIVRISRSDQFEEVEQQLSPDDLEVSVVIPCLNEAETIAHCIGIARQALESHFIRGEVVVADNGSTDNSAMIAQAAGARVVHVSERGYGSALIGGINAARGKYIVMGDADGSYDFGEIPHFLEKLREGYSLVQGCRLRSGGGTVERGAMPLLHRWFGNPFFSWLARLLYQAPIHDVNCGLRAFSKELYNRINQRCTGMEFAVEMVLKSSLYGERIAEVPITLSPDKRVHNKPHLKTFRDGWRTLRFYLICSPRWLFLYPGIFLMLLGVLGYGLSFTNLALNGIRLDLNTLVISCFCILAGYQACIFGVTAKTFAITEELLPPDPKFSKLFEVFTLERGLIVSSVIGCIGAALILSAFLLWQDAGFGEVDSHVTLRLVVTGTLGLAIALHTVLSSFLLSVIGMQRRREPCSSADL